MKSIQVPWEPSWNHDLRLHLVRFIHGIEGGGRFLTPALNHCRLIWTAVKKLGELNSFKHRGLTAGGSHASCWLSPVMIGYNMFWTFEIRLRSETCFWIYATQGVRPNLVRFTMMAWPIFVVTCDWLKLLWGHWSYWSSSFVTMYTCIYRYTYTREAL